MSFQLCRRQVLGIGAGIAAAGVLAGCSETTEELEEGTVLADAADIAEGEAIPVAVGDTSMILTHTPEGTFRAFSAVCTHQGCNVSDASAEILECHVTALSSTPTQEQFSKAPRRRTCLNSP